MNYRIGNVRLPQNSVAPAKAGVQLLCCINRLPKIGYRPSLVRQGFENRRISNASTGGPSGAYIREKARQCLRSVSLLIGGLLLCTWVLAQTPTPPMPPASSELELRLKQLETELRCMVCQNQTLAESPAGLAGDLRREIRLLADQGKSNDEIKIHLKARYGDFILYKPTVESKTWLLWFGPFVLLVGGGLLVTVILRRTRRASEANTAEIINAEESARARKLFGE